MKEGRREEWERDGHIASKKKKKREEERGKVETKHDLDETDRPSPRDWSSEKKKKKKEGKDRKTRRREK